VVVIVVWLPMLEGDTEAAAQGAADTILADPRVRHLYDPERHAGRAIARHLGAEQDQVAWDIYLFYEPGAEWREAPPTPAAWMHQLTNSRWADPAHYHSGQDLVEELEETMKRLSKDGGE
jgi:hypothetical protein